MTLLGWAHRSRTAEARRWYRATMGGITIGVAGLFVLELVVGWESFGWGREPGVDLSIYVDATRRLLSGGLWFLDYQSAPYAITMGAVLYPPVTAWLFAPFLVLPAILWWTPVLVTGWLVWSWKPATWAYPLIALALLWPFTAARLITGNPVMWAVMFTALGLRYSWPAALVLLKPSLFPFALIGIRDRRWWLAVAGLSLLSLPFLPTSLAWFGVVRNGGGDVLYSLVDVPAMLIPVIAWRASLVHRRLSSA